MPSSAILSSFHRQFFKDKKVAEHDRLLMGSYSSLAKRLSETTLYSASMIDQLISLLSDRFLPSEVNEVLTCAAIRNIDPFELVPLLHKHGCARYHLTDDELMLHRAAHTN